MGEIVPIGKNFSMNNLGQRRKSDFYETPYSLTRLFLEKERLSGSILEPACGDGAIVRVLSEFGYTDIECYDIEVNFLTETRPFNTIITNPPYSLAGEFIAHAKRVSNDFHFLLPLSYLHGKKRYDEVYADRQFPLRKVHVFTRYPMLGEPLREDGKHSTGMMVYAWFSFTRGYRGEPKLGWLDNNEYVARKR